MAVSATPPATAVLLVGSAEEAAPLRVDLRRAPERSASVAGVVLPESVTQPSGKPPADGPLVLRAAELSATVVVLGAVAEADDSVIDQAAALHSRGMRLRSYAQFTDEWLGQGAAGRPRAGLAAVRRRRGPPGPLRPGEAPLRHRPSPWSAWSCSSLLVPFVVLGDLVANRGPLLFGQERVGKGGGSFRILKFRTMEPRESTVGDATEIGDPRVTPFGRFLRKSHLDEVPQSWNVLKGDLSIVGPRPEQPHYVEAFSAALPFYDLRHLVRPGITGWAQVKYHYGTGEEDAREKLQYEFWYLRHQGLTVDLRIIGRTIRSVVRSEGR